MQRTAIYARSSPAYPQTNEDQRTRLFQIAVDRGLTVTSTLSDTAPTSTKTTRRPGLDALLRIIERREVDIIAVCSVNLLGRSLPELLTILTKATDRGIGIIALDQGIDSTVAPSMPFAELVTLLNGYTKFQRREAAMIGQQAARAAGVKFGRPAISETKLAKAREALAAGLGIRPSARLAGISPAKVSEIHRQMANSNTSKAA